jgi:predicted PurR-regulated permease PerM
MPDFVVLIATLSGLELFGLNGFVVGPVIAALFMAVWTQQRDSRLAMAQAAEEKTASGDAAAQAHPS